MATDCITQVTFQGDGFAKPVVARFDRPDASTDGGLMLVKALDTQLGLTERLAACLDDAREPGKVLHEMIALLQQRIFGLCAGYADCNDAARLVHDPIHKLMVGRDPLTGLGLASQPTLSRCACQCSLRPASVQRAYLQAWPPVWRACARHAWQLWLCGVPCPLRPVWRLLRHWRQATQSRCAWGPYRR